MIIPIKLAGVALACKTLQLYGARRNDHSIPRPNLISVFSQAIASKFKAKQRNTHEDYMTVITNTIPQEARLLTPTYRTNSNAYELWDIDGDRENELVTSYILNDEITTIVIKNQNDLWNIASEIKIPGTALNYRSLANVVGKGKQLLIGYEDKDGNKEIAAYTLSDYDAKKLFSHRYNKFDFLKLPDRYGENSNSHMIFWNKNQRGSYDVDIKRWDGNSLKDPKNYKDVLIKGVLPLYAKKLKRNPEKPDNWYRFAVALENAGLKKEALYIIKKARLLKLSNEVLQDFDELEQKIRQST